MERLEELNLNGLKIYQDDELYCFTSDAVLLTKFVKAKKGETVADFCSGSGIVGLHFYALNPSVKEVCLFEMQKKLYDLSLKSIKINGLEDKFFAYNCKVQDIGNEFNGKFSLILSNPPYMEVNSGSGQENLEIALCRREIELPLNELIKAISKNLKFGGRTAIVHRADRLADVIELMRKNKIEPKRLQFVCGGKKEPYLFMIEGVLGGKKGGLKVLKEIEN